MTPQAELRSRPGAQDLVNHSRTLAHASASGELGPPQVKGSREQGRGGLTLNSFPLLNQP